MTDPAVMTPRELHSHWITRSGREGADGSADARFPYWSFTKTAIAICALGLVERQALDLDRPLEGQPFTLRQLLQHMSGLPDYGSLEAYHTAVARCDEPWPRERLLDTALAQGMRFAPGEGWSYSNIGYLLVTDMIEEAAGKPLRDVFSELISGPLELSTIRFWQTPDQSASLHWDGAVHYHPGWVYHGCLIGSAADAARLLHALFEGRLLQADTLRLMRGHHSIGGPLAGRPWTACGYGLGLMAGTMGRAGTAIGHSGGGPFSVNAVYHFPDLPDQPTVACFTNGTDEAPAEHTAANLARTL